MPNSTFLIPEDVSCVPVYVFSGVIGLFTIAIYFLLRLNLKLDKKINEVILEHKADLKGHSERIENISQTGTNVVLLNLEKQLTRLETLIASLRKIFDAILSNLNK